MVQLVEPLLFVWKVVGWILGWVKPNTRDKKNQNMHIFVIIF